MFSFLKKINFSPKKFSILFFVPTLKSTNINHSNFLINVCMFRKL